MRDAITKVRNGYKGITILFWVLLIKIILNLIGAKPRVIKGVPNGFDDHDIKIANEANEAGAKVAKHLASSSQNRENIYQIGIAFVGRGDGSLLSRGHAEIVIRDGDGLSTVSPPGDLNLAANYSTTDQNEPTRSGPDALFKTDDIRLRVCHIHNTKGRVDSLELTLEEKSKVQYYKYFDLYRIRMTERRLRHLALISCPRRYTILVDDCATFCRTFLEALSDYLLERGKDDGGIDRDQHSRQKRLLRHIHVEDGWVGATEWRGAVSPA